MEKKGRTQNRTTAMMLFGFAASALFAAADWMVIRNFDSREAEEPEVPVKRRIRLVPVDISDAEQKIVSLRSPGEVICERHYGMSTYWTGSNWSRVTSDAYIYPDRDSADRELARLPLPNVSGVVRDVVTTKEWEIGDRAVK